MCRQVKDHLQPFAAQPGLLGPAGSRQSSPIFLWAFGAKVFIEFQRYAETYAETYMDQTHDKNMSPKLRSPYTSAIPGSKEEAARRWDTQPPQTAAGAASWEIRVDTVHHPIGGLMHSVNGDHISDTLQMDVIWIDNIGLRHG